MEKKSNYIDIYFSSYLVFVINFYVNYIMKNYLYFSSIH